MKDVKVLTRVTVEGDKLEQEVTQSCGSAALIDEPIPKGSTSLACAIAFAYLKLKHIYLEAAGATLTVLFNYEVGSKSITLVPGTPFCWTDGLGPVNPFTDDVVNVEVTEADVAAGTLSGVIGVDLT